MFMNLRKALLCASLLTPTAVWLGEGTAVAAVIVNGASGGSGLSADTASNASSPQWTTLGPIVIGEGSDADFAAGTNVTLVLNAPVGFEFNPAVVPDASFTAGKDITAADVAMTSSTTLTVTLTVSGTNSP